MLIFFFKIRVKLPQLFWFAVLVAVNGEFLRFYRFRVRRLPERNKRKTNRQYSPKFAIYFYKDDKAKKPRYFALNTKLVIFAYKSFKLKKDCLGSLWSNKLPVGFYFNHVHPAYTEKLRCRKWNLQFSKWLSKAITSAISTSVLEKITLLEGKEEIEGQFWRYPTKTTEVS